MDVKKELDNYLLASRKEMFEYNTLVNYKCRIKAFLVYFEHKASPEAVTLEEFKMFLDLKNSLAIRPTVINAVKSFYLLTGRTSIDFSGFNKTPRKKQPRYPSPEISAIKYVCKKLGVKETDIELIPPR